MRHGFLIVMLLCAYTTLCATARVFVYSPSAARPQAMQKQLGEAYPQIEFTVFGRYRDFVAEIQARRPDATIAPPLLMQQVPGYATRLTALRNGSASEPLVLLSVDKSLDTARIGEWTLGALDFMGRPRMELLIRECVGGTPKMQFVAKVEDLLPLLTFGMADAILVTQMQVVQVTRTSQRKFYSINVSHTRLGILVLAVRGDVSGAAIVEAIRNDSRGFSILEVQGWQ